MKDNDATIIAIVSIALTLGFFGFLAYLLLKKEPEPITTAQTQASQPQIYVPAENKIVATEEVRPTTPHIINHYLNEAGRWYEIKLPKDMRTWQMRARGDYDIHYSFEPTHSTYMILVSGATLSENTAPNMDIQTIYVMSNTANSIVDLELWRNNG